MKKYFIVNVFAIWLAISGCLATKLLLPGGEPLTEEETSQLESIKETVDVVVEGGNSLNKILVPGGGAGAALLAALVWYLNRRRKRNV